MLLEKTMNEIVVLSTPDEIAWARILTLRSGLKLETKGMKKRGRSCLDIVKEEFGFKGDVHKVYAQLDEYIKKAKGEA